LASPAWQAVKNNSRAKTALHVFMSSLTHFVMNNYAVKHRSSTPEGAWFGKLTMSGNLM